MSLASESGPDPVEEEVRIAVVIPAYHSAAFLVRTLESVLAQSRPADEILVVDDGSPDGIAEICEVYGDRVLYVRQDNRGPAAARNTGASLTDADWLAFLDADDLWEPEKLERQLDALGRHPDWLLCGSGARRFLEGEGGDRELDAKPLAGDLDLASLLAANPLTTSSILLRREAWEEAGGFDEDRALIAVEDYDLWLRIRERGPIGVVEEPLVGYRVHESSLSGAVRFAEGVERVLQKAEGRLEAVEPQDLLRSAIRKHRARLARDLAWERLESGDSARGLRAAFRAMSLSLLSASSWRILAKALLASFLRRSRVSG